MKQRIAGVILAGGRSSRMGGGDKCLLDLGGRPILAHVIGRFAPQVASLALNANGDAARFAAFGLPVVTDRVPEFAGPLAGMLAAMEWATRLGFPVVATAAADTPFIPAGLVERLEEARRTAGSAIAIACSDEGVHPVFGLFDTGLRNDLDAHLRDGGARVRNWLDRHTPAEARFPPFRVDGVPVDPFFNVNAPEDLEAARGLLKGKGP